MRNDTSIRLTADDSTAGVVVDTARIVWRGPSRFTGVDTVAVLGLTGNAATGECVGLVVCKASAWRDVMIAERAEHANNSKRMHARNKALYYALKGDMAAGCGDCVHTDGKCYVNGSVQNVGQPAKMLSRVPSAPAAMAFDSRAARAVYRQARGQGVRRVRFAVSGDSGALPAEVWAGLWAATPDDFERLAYTHAWRSAPWLRESHMASVETAEEYREARDLGWRCYYVGAADAQVMPAGAQLCPKSRERVGLTRRKLSCAACFACDGARDGDKRPSMFIPRHSQADSARKARAARSAFVIRDARGHVRGAYVGKVA